MRTGKWLIKERKAEGLNQEQLSDILKIDLKEIQNIENGSELGSADIWDKLENYFPKYAKYSYDSEDLITELEQDIAEFGEEETCVLFYKNIDERILFTNYDFVVEGVNYLEELEEDEKYIISNFKYALEVFKAQNELF